MLQKHNKIGTFNRPILQQGCHYGFLKHFPFIKNDVDIRIPRQKISLTPNFHIDSVDRNELMVI